MGFALVNDISAIFFGCIFASIFYGVTSIQTYIYFNRSQGDRFFYKFAFGCLWILDTIHTVIVVYLVYSYGIVASVSHLDYQPDWKSSVLIIISNLSDLGVRLVFMHRIWLLTHRRFLVLIPIGIMSWLTTGLGFSYGIRMSYRDFTALSSISWQLYATLASAVVTDLMITATLCVIFHRMRSGFERSDSILTKLITYTISSGLLTRWAIFSHSTMIQLRMTTSGSLVAIGTFTTYAVLPDTYIFMSVFFVVSKTSFNALLAATTARPHLREKMFGLDEAQRMMGLDTAPISVDQDKVVTSLPTTDESIPDFNFSLRRLDNRSSAVISGSWRSTIGVAV
ncbi:hypothetical protein BDY19DRAFT_995589 [Irpex rosettiformis]|uniref:Uncharacterized protein n=1 Tax=Irpex rosettiformis TaxID=378272 RepID=A0ACB8TXP4_9APHY|nr:hypothetical protein BDY19DRAFT_995589 [Irpex rosettiformis]